MRLRQPILAVVIALGIVATGGTKVPSPQTPQSSGEAHSQTSTDTSPQVSTLALPETSSGTQVQPAQVQVTTASPDVPFALPTDPVRIAAIELPSDTIRGGDVARATVITTSNAAAVTARVGRYVFDLTKTAPGTFVAAVRVPRLPFPSYHARIVVTAIRADGASTQTSVAVKIKY